MIEIDELVNFFSSVVFDSFRCKMFPDCRRFPGHNLGDNTFDGDPDEIGILVMIP